MPTISAVALPDHLEENQLRDRIAVVIDVLRATTTIAQALSCGASCIVPVASIDAARMIAHERTGSLLCGERAGIKPQGFQLGNSPSEYNPVTVSGKDLVLTTTNGTRALHMCTEAHAIFTGSITNLSALANELDSHGRDIVLVCSGTDRRVSLEDCICAGLIADRLMSSYKLDDSALQMLHAADGANKSNGGLEQAIASSFHAKRLIEKGFQGDLHNAAQLDTSACLPCFDAATGEIRPASQLNQAHG